jgi:homopolymeric O-antigen transport system permease protein
MPDSLPTIVYTAESSLRQPRTFVRGLWAGVRAARQLAAVLFQRNVRAQYRQSLLGYVWLFLPPIVTTLTWVFLNAAGVLSVQPADVPYPLYVLIGTLLWQGFVDALNTPLSQLTANKPLLSKVNFPSEALIMAGFAEVLLNFAVRLLLLMVIFLFMRFHLPPTILLAPLGMLAVLLLGLTIGMWLVPIGMLYQDIQRGLGVATGLWFFVTPIVYTPPTTFPFTLIVSLNPVTPLIVTTRDWLTTGLSTQPGKFLLVIIFSVVGLLVGWIVLRLALPHLIARTLTR